MKQGPFKGYDDLTLQSPGPSPLRGDPDDPAGLVAFFKLDNDPSALFPYINAVARKAVYSDSPPFIRFLLDDRLCLLHPGQAVAGAFEDRHGAKIFIGRLIDYLNDIHARRDAIEPDFKPFRPVSVVDILKLLPRTNCRQCGFATCMAFAAALRKGEVLPRQCPDFTPPMAEQAVYPILDGDGKVVSTVAIDIDSSQSQKDVDAQETLIAGLRKKLSDVTRSAPATIEVGEDKIKARLTGREIQVLKLLANGSTNAQISEILAISPHTVKSHVIHIFNKLGVSDRTQAAVWAARCGLL